MGRDVRRVVEDADRVSARARAGPFVIAVLRYAVDVDCGNAGEPEEIALRDRVLQVLGATWVVTLACSYYL